MQLRIKKVMSKYPKIGEIIEVDEQSRIDYLISSGIAERVEQEVKPAAVETAKANQATARRKPDPS